MRNTTKLTRAEVKKRKEKDPRRLNDYGRRREEFNLEFRRYLVSPELSLRMTAENTLPKAISGRGEKELRKAGKSAQAFFERKEEAVAEAFEHIEELYTEETLRRDKEAAEAYRVWANDVPFIDAKTLWNKLRRRKGSSKDFWVWKRAYLANEAKVKAKADEELAKSRAEKITILRNEGRLTDEQISKQIAAEEAKPDCGTADSWLLTAEEAAWIIHYSEVTTKITARVQLNPRHPKLNVVEPPMRKVESKIGRVYNNWKIVALKGEDENTANHAKVMYEFACQTCGHLVECAYNNIHKKVCMECKRKARETTEIPEKLLRGVQSQWVIYLLENGGWQLSSRGLQPANATKKAFLTHRDTPMAWLDLNAKCSDHFQREAEEEEQEEPTPEHLIREIQDIPDIPDPMDL